MPAETLTAPIPQPETPIPFDPASTARAWLQSAADTDGLLPWAWTPSVARNIGVNSTATTIVAEDPGEWWEHTGERGECAFVEDGWQRTSWPQIRAALTGWGQAHAGFSEHPGRADATAQKAHQWLRSHASHGHGDAGPQQYGRPPTTWEQRGANGELPDDARGCAEVFIAELHYPPAPQGGRRLAYWHSSYHRWTPDGWERVNNADTITDQIRGWLDGHVGVSIPHIDLEVLAICGHAIGMGNFPTPLDLADHDQHMAAQHAAKTIVPQPIGAPA